MVKREINELPRDQDVIAYVPKLQKENKRLKRELDELRRSSGTQIADL